MASRAEVAASLWAAVASARNHPKGTTSPSAEGPRSSVSSCWAEGDAAAAGTPRGMLAELGTVPLKSNKAIESPSKDAMPNLALGGRASSPAATPAFAISSCSSVPVASTRATKAAAGVRSTSPPPCPFPSSSSSSSWLPFSQTRSTKPD